MNTKLDHAPNWAELARQANWSALRLAKNCGISLRTSQRYFLKEMGKTPKAWLSEYRQHQATELLHSGSSVKETAARLGYKHPSHFTNDFKKQSGYSPTKMRVPTRAGVP